MAAKRPFAVSLALLLVAVFSKRLLQPWVVAPRPTNPVALPMTFALAGLPQVATNGSFGVGRSSGSTQRKALFDPNAVKRFLHLSRYPVVWKERWMGPANLDRAGLRLDGMDTYAVLGAVLLQVLMGMYGVIAEPEEKASRKERILYELQMLCMTVSVLSSSFTMIMFLLNKIYASSALAMYKDVAYALFQQATAQHRVHAFWSLIISIVSFLVCFSLNLSARIKGRLGIVIAAVTLCSGCVMLSEWTKMMDLAAKYIYTA